MEERLVDYKKGYVFELMAQRGPTDNREPYFKDAVDEMMRARTLCAKANACMPDDPSYVGYLEELFDRKLDDLVNHDNWIIDGDYSRTYEKRIAACDTIFFLDYDVEVCLQGIRDRVGKERRDIPWTDNKLDPELVKLVKNYETEDKPVLIELFNKYSDKDIIMLHSREEAYALLKNMITDQNDR